MNTDRFTDRCVDAINSNHQLKDSFKSADDNTRKQMLTAVWIGANTYHAVYSKTTGTSPGSSQIEGELPQLNDFVNTALPQVKKAVTA